MRRALVTGGTSPLGSVMCRRLAAEGLHVIVHTHAIPTVPSRWLRRSRHLEVRPKCCIATSPTSRPPKHGSTVAGGAPQILVHNAGTHDDVPMAGMSEAQWRSAIDVSLHGFYAVARPLLLPMMGTRWGRIIAISSVAALTGNRGQVNYSAAKAGLIGAVKSLAREVASRGITVNAVAPGIIASPAVDEALDRQQIAEIVPMKQAGRRKRWRKSSRSWRRTARRT